MPISFCGGADAWNFADLVADGLAPVTVCTDLLKPGGYARLQQYLENLGDGDDRRRRRRASTRSSRPPPAGAAAAGTSPATSSGSSPTARRRYARRERPLVFKGSRALGPFDCIAAPCMEACPAHQNIPDYLWLVAHGRDDEAIEVIRRSNALPGVTGSICDHPCTERCVRNLYDAPLGIREIKRFAFENGVSKPEAAAAPKGVKVAIVGAGPAGISAALNLARVGFAPELFEAKEHAGGMVGGAVPALPARRRQAQGRPRPARVARREDPLRHGRRPGRLPRGAARRASPTSSSASAPRRGSGSGSPARTPRGSSTRSSSSTASATGVKRDLGRRVLVVGGGNSAMDGARSARRLVGGRRGLPRLPPDPRRDARRPGGSPRLRRRGNRPAGPPRAGPRRRRGGRAVGLACTRMKLGEPDASGRPRPVPLDGSEVVLPADTIVTAIGQEPALEFLGGTALDAKRRRDARRPTRDGGDLASRALRRRRPRPRPRLDHQGGRRRPRRRRGDRPPPRLRPGPRAAARQGTLVAAMMEKKSRLARPEPCRSSPSPSAAASRRSSCPSPPRRPAARPPAASTATRSAASASRSARTGRTSPTPCRRSRSSCPSFVVGGGAPSREGTTAALGRAGRPDRQPRRRLQRVRQLRHLLPHLRRALAGQAAFWIDREGFAEAKGDAFRMTRTGGSVVIEARIAGRTHRLERRGGAAEYRSEPLRASLDAATWTSSTPAPRGRPPRATPRPRGLRPPDRAAPRGAGAPAPSRPRRRRRHPSPRREKWQTRTASTRSTRSCRPRG